MEVDQPTENVETQETPVVLPVYTLEGKLTGIFIC